MKKTKKIFNGDKKIPNTILALYLLNRPSTSKEILKFFQRNKNKISKCSDLTYPHKLSNILYQLLDIGMLKRVDEKLISDTKIITKSGSERVSTIRRYYIGKWAIDPDIIYKICFEKRIRIEYLRDYGNYSTNEVTQDRKREFVSALLGWFSPLYLYGLREFSSDEDKTALSKTYKEYIKIYNKLTAPQNDYLLRLFHNIENFGLNTFAIYLLKKIHDIDKIRARIMILQKSKSTDFVKKEEIELKKLCENSGLIFYKDNVEKQYWIFPCIDHYQFLQLPLTHFIINNSFNL